jgi:hypothetical protein
VVWEAALGAQISSRALPLRLTRGELLVSVPDAVWRQELSLLAPEIVARLNARLGEPVVTRLRLIGATGARTASVAPARRLRRQEASAPADEPPPLAVGAEIGAALADLWRARARRLARYDDSQDKVRRR